MSKYIDADELTEKCRDKAFSITIEGKYYHVLMLSVGEIEKIANEMPAADVEPVMHGEWIKGRCSACGAVRATDSLFDYLDEGDQEFCYSCGAKMDGGSE